MSTPESQIHTLLINGRFLTQSVSGVQTFARSVCSELIENKINIKIIVPIGTEINDRVFEPFLIFTGKLNGHLWEQIYLSAFVKKQNDAILLNLCNTGPLGIKNQAVTIHDLAFLKNPKWFHPFFRIWYKFMIPKLVKNSKHIFTVSNAVKEEVASEYKVNKSKVTVLTNKVSDRFLKAEEHTPVNFRFRPKSFFLMVGSDDPRKNFGFVEAAFTTGEYQTILVIAGGSNRNFGNTKHLSSPNIYRTGYVSESELKWLYKNAIALINPSLYEGFGIPNIEAFALECPVLCSDIPPFKEVCSDAAFYFKANERESLKIAISDVLKNNELVHIKTTKGKVIFTNSQNQNRSSKILKALFE